jgi:hypothetical protein
MSLEKHLIGSGISFAADKLLNQGKFKKPSIIDIYTGGGYTGEGTGEKTTKGPTTLGGIAKQGILSVLARSILGPILGPIALTLGTNIFNKRKEQGLGIMPFGGPFNFGRTPPAPTVEETAGKYGITDIENIKDYKPPEDSGPAGDPSLTYDYGITQGIDSGDSAAVADAIDNSTPDDFGQSEGMVDGWED